MDIWSTLRPFGIFYGHSVYFMDIWSTLRPFGIFYGRSVFCGHLVYFSHFGMLHQEKSGNPAQHTDVEKPGTFARRPPGEWLTGSTWS
jgi:hypothetical protein